MDQVSFSGTEFASIIPSRIGMVNPGGGIQLWVFGVLVTLKALGNETLGSYGVMEHLVHQGRGQPSHLHVNEEEYWYLLDGELTWTVKGQEFQATKGCFIHLPRLVSHAFINKLNSPARMLVSFSPAGLEKWYLQVGTPVVDLHEDPPEVTELETAKVISSAMNFGLVFPDRIGDSPVAAALSISSAVV